MRKIYIKYIATIFFLGFIISGNAQVTGLSDYSIFIDPGHAQDENMGLYNYSEAKKVLRVALELKALFENQTDIKAVHLSRSSDAEYQTLTGRTDLANSLGVDFYYSIHSDAGDAGTNSTLTMYGGWRKNSVTVEKYPYGGKAFGEILYKDLTGAMRIPSRGNYADRVYYEGSPATHDRQYPYLHVNRETNCASLLSEAGFHTNPEQQQLNVNANWKKLEALAAFRSFLEYKNIDRPAIGVLAGIIRDSDTGEPINGVKVTVGDTSCTTDTYESLFHEYSNNPDQMHNGFYWFDHFTPGDSVDVVFTSDIYVTKTVSVKLKSAPNGRTADNITFLDVKLKNSIPATVSGVEMEDEPTHVMPGHPIQLNFSRGMDTTSVKQALSLQPSAPFTCSWTDDATLILHTDSLAYLTAYQLIIGDSIAMDADTKQWFDGNGDGIPGGAYTLPFTTAPEDLNAPFLVDYWPAQTEASVELRPVIRLVFNEAIAESSINPSTISVYESGSNEQITGKTDHFLIGKQTVFHFYPTADLKDGNSYVVEVQGIEDLNGNKAENISFTFDVDEMPVKESTYIDRFGTGITGWKQPTSSLNTLGVVRTNTNIESESSITCKLGDDNGAMKLNYEWVDGYSNPYIREILSSTSEQYAIHFNKDYMLQLYVFGDGSENQFRIALKDGNNQVETCRWYNIDWLGWKLITWDLSNDTVLGYSSGNGVLDGSDFSIEGIHMTHPDSASLTGAIVFDDLRFILKGSPTGIPLVSNETQIKMYPNPAVNTLQLESGNTIKSVSIYSFTGQLALSQELNQQSAVIDISKLQPGIYLVNTETDSGVQSAKLQVIR